MEQSLRHAGYGSYSGLLTVALDDGTQHKIGIDNFVEYPFWDCPFALPRAEPEFWTNSTGVVIATLAHGARAVDRDGEWMSLKPRDHLLCDINVRPYTNKIECTVLDSRDRRQDRVEVNPMDARVVY